MAKAFDKTPEPLSYVRLLKKGAVPFWLLVAVSFLLHFSAVWKLGEVGKVNLGASKNDNIDIKVVSVPKKDTKTKKLLEAKQEKTEKPDNPRYKGAQDHKTEKETKTEFRPQEKALDPGLAGTATKTVTAKPQQKQQVKKKKEKSQQQLYENGDIAVSKRKPRNKYEALMPTNSDLANVVKSGYQDYLDEDLDVGERIDINTSDYRYIGYFTSLRKAVELVWTYPREAVRRGLQGEVGVEFTIMKDGSVKKVRVIRSSGHKILDKSVVEAIKLASPYTPLPDGFEKKKLVIVGGFRYVLSNFGGRIAR